MWYKNKFYSNDDVDGMSEIVRMTIDDCGYKCEDGHYLTADELNAWSDEMFIKAFQEIYPMFAH